ncbi:MAG: hypothetical protein ACJ789_02780 [Thermomicrobiales bacterium]
MIARLLVSIGSVAASVGLVVFGMGTSFVESDDSLINLGLGLMIGGVIAAVVGAVIYRATEGKNTTLAERTTRHG